MLNCGELKRKAEKPVIDPLNGLFEAQIGGNLCGFVDLCVIEASADGHIFNQTV